MATKTQYFITEQEALYHAQSRGGSSCLCADHNPPWKAEWEEPDPVPEPKAKPKAEPEPAFDPPIPKAKGKE